MHAKKCTKKLIKKGKYRQSYVKKIKLHRVELTYLTVMIAEVTSLASFLPADLHDVNVIYVRQEGNMLQSYDCIHFDLMLCKKEIYFVRKLLKVL